LRTVHYIALAAALALIAILYWGVPTAPPAGSASGTGASGHVDAGAKPAMPQIVPASFDSILTASRAALPQHAVAELDAIDKQIAGLQDSSAMAPLFEQSAALWMEHKQAPMAAWARAKGAHLARSEKKLNFAGQFFLDLMHEATTPGMQAWEAQGAVDCLGEALKLNPDNDTTKLALASAYIEGTGAPMSGITILREMVAKDPNHIPANLMLGRLSITSGQFDKAVARLEHVLELEPQNREALYFLAEAYKGKGDKDKAIATLRKLEGIVNKPEFTKDIEAYITSFK
jgi:tetratricopeptide (TPR) repeat protein